VVLAVGLAAIGGLAAALVPRGRGTVEAAPAVSAGPVPSAEAAAGPDDLGIGDPSAVHPSELLGRARVRALAWNREALLLAIRAEPVVSGAVNLTSGGTIEYWFGKPTGEGFGAGAKVSGKRLRIALGQSGTKVEETGGGIGRAALEPNCPLEEALRKAQAAGVSPSLPVTASYQFDDKRTKTSWRIATTGSDPVTRIVDGWSCAILVH
jgi:hypothetical protein